MTFLEFILSYSILLVLGSFLVYQWHYLTRHSLEVQPNGKVKRIGFIVSGWSAYWQKQIGIEKVYYEGDAEKALVEAIKPIWDINKIPEIEQQIGCKIEVTDDEIFFYLEEPIYRFPEWIRNPISECPTCMSSVYGSVIYFFYCLLIKDLFLWANYPIIGILFFWCIFVVVLSFLINLIVKYF